MNKVMNKDTKIQISLHQNNIGSKGCSVLFNTLKECNSIVNWLYFQHNRIGDECMKQVGEYIQDNQHLKKIDFSKNMLTDEGVEILSEYVIGNTVLKELDLSYSKGITDKSVPYLIEMAKKSCITSFILHFTSISDEKKEEIEDALSIPMSKREIPIESNTKSAAKISVST